MLRSLLISIALITPAIGQELPPYNRVPLSDLNLAIESYQTVPTFTEVETMKRMLDEAVAAKNCKQVIAQGQDFARAAGLLVSLAGWVSAPARGFPPDAAPSFPSSSVADDVDARLYAFIVGRGQAFLATADCYASSKAQGQAIKFYLQALDAFPAGEQVLWDRAVTGLWTELGAIR